MGKIKISLVITSFNEPETIGKAIESFISQNIKQEYELYVCAPDNATLDIAKKFQEKNKKIKIFQDPGKGKSFALNLLLPTLKGKIIILTDGDVYVSNNSVNELLKFFKDSKVGCVTGRPISSDNKNNMFGYWSHLLCDAAHQLRLKRNQKKEFLECSGYLWAFRNKVIKKFPLDLAEDMIVPIMFFLKGYDIKYANRALVYVKFPVNLKDFVKQKRRTAVAHDNLGKYVNPKKIPRMKTFGNEISGSLNVFYYTKNLREIYWTFVLFPIRFYIWINMFYHSRFKKRKYSDSWKRIETTK